MMNNVMTTWFSMLASILLPGCGGATTDAAALPLT